MLTPKTRYTLIGFLVFILILMNLNNYSYLFAKRVQGEVVAIERVTHSTTIIGDGNTVPPVEVFSFTVAVRDLKNGDIFTSSTTDRQWAIVYRGLCADVRFFPYPPWNLKNRGSYKDTQLLKLYECPPSEFEEIPLDEEPSEATEQA